MFSNIASVMAAVSAMTALAFAAAIPQTSANENQIVKRALSGQATYYGGNVQGGTCSFSTYTLPKGLYGTALSDSNWANSANCGGCVKVNYGSKSITAMIVDQCPGCGTNHLDLFPDAFAALASPSAGVIDITWDYVRCPDITGDIQIHMKSGVSAYWFSAQVVNANERTTKMEVSTDSGKTWKTATRQTYNFFEISSGVGASTAWVRVTSESNTQVVVKNVPMTSNAVVTATANYA